MTEKEVEMAYKKMAESDAPDLWARVESNLPEKEIQPEMKVKKGFFAKTGIFRRQYMENIHCTVRSLHHCIWRSSGCRRYVQSRRI